VAADLAGIRTLFSGDAKIPSAPAAKPKPSAAATKPKPTEPKTAPVAAQSSPTPQPAPENKTPTSGSGDDAAKVTAQSTAESTGDSDKGGRRMFKRPGGKPDS